MTRHAHVRRAAAIACLLWFLVPVTPEAQGLFDQRGRWWRDKEIQRDLGLTPAQVESLETVFGRKLEKRIELRLKLDEMDAALAKVIAQGEADDETVLRLITQVERLRAERNASRTLLLVKMYRILTPAQRLRLAEAHKPAQGAPKAGASR